MNNNKEECRVLGFRNGRLLTTTEEIHDNEIICEIWKEQLTVQRELKGKKIGVKNKHENSSL